MAKLAQKRPVWTCLMTLKTPLNTKYFGILVLNRWRTLPLPESITWTVACTEMTKSKKIKIVRAVYVVGLFWASIVIIFSFKSLRLSCCTLPCTYRWSIENKQDQQVACETKITELTWLHIVSPYQLKPDLNQTWTIFKPDLNQTKTRLKPDLNQT